VKWSITDALPPNLLHILTETDDPIALAPKTLNLTTPVLLYILTLIEAPALHLSVTDILPPSLIIFLILTELAPQVKPMMLKAPAARHRP
jgi:hypothetical protein